MCRKNREATLQAIANLRYKRAQRTNTQAALALASRDVFTSRHGDRPHADNVIIIITDGRSSPETRRPEPEAERLRAAGVRIVVVGVTNLIDEEELRRLSSAPHRRNRLEEEGVGGRRGGRRNGWEEEQEGRGTAWRRNRWEEELAGGGTGGRMNKLVEEQVGGGTGGRMNRLVEEQMGGGTGGKRSRWTEAQSHKRASTVR